MRIRRCCTRGYILGLYILALRFRCKDIDECYVYFLKHYKPFYGHNAKYVPWGTHFNIFMCSFYIFSFYCQRLLFLAEIKFSYSTVSFTSLLICPILSRYKYWIKQNRAKRLLNAYSTDEVKDGFQFSVRQSCNGNESSYRKLRH